MIRKNLKKIKMPLPLIPLLGAALPGVSSILGNILNNKANAKANEQQEDFAREMYDRQRSDSLADYAMQNEYNSPKNQMARLRDAGLNPNLVYGNGATATGGTVRSSTVPGYSPNPNRYDLSGLGDSIANYQNLKVSEAQTDNLTKQNTILAQEAELKKAQTLSTLAEANNKTFDLDLKNKLKDISLEMAGESLKNLKFDVDTKDINLERAKFTFSASVKQAIAESNKAANEAGASDLLKKRVEAEIKNLEKDGDLKQFQINLNKLGINSSDPWYLRIVTQLFGKYLPKP